MGARIGSMQFSFILVFNLPSMEVVATVSSHPFMMLHELCRYDIM